MSPVGATPLCGHVKLPPLQGSSEGVLGQPRPCSLGYGLKVSPSGLLVERSTSRERMTGGCEVYPIPPIEFPKPPIEFPTPPIEFPIPPIEFPKPPIELSIPPIEFPTPPIEFPIPPIEFPIPPIEFSIPPIEFSIPPIENPGPPVVRPGRATGAARGAGTKKSLPRGAAGSKGD